MDAAPSNNGDSTRTSKLSTCSSPRRSNGWWNWSSRRSSRPSWKSRPLRKILLSGKRPSNCRTYNAYSIDGDVTGPLVYVNYGIPDDYDRLARLGIDVKGAIVIARYGGSWRGIKPKVAAEHGAIGCIIYSDPRDDGYFEGDVFPSGPYRNSNGVQRGSVADMPLYPGDPLTPGVGSTADAKRLSLSEAKTITKIPVLPISYGDAQPLLAELAGPTAPEEWRGALPITYHLGPGPAKVHLLVKSNWDTKPVNDVIVTIPGSEYPDQWVIRGNHHDAWVNGADDPVSGISAEMEELRRIRWIVEAGLASETHDHLRRVGRRRTRLARLHRMGGNTCIRAAAESRCLHQLRFEFARIPRHWRNTFARGIH